MSNTRNIKFIPSSNKNNKYIELLLRALEISGNDSFKIGQTNIIHLHWSTNLYGSKYILKSLFLICKGLFIYMYLKLVYNIKIVWTIHNFYAHDYPHPLLDRICRKVLFYLSDVLIFQQNKTYQLYKKTFPYKNIYYIPHINYVNAYGDKVEKNFKLRKDLGLEENDIVFLSLGAIAPYKRNEKIIEKIIESSRSNRLLIIGKGSQEYINTLPKHEKVIIKNMYIPDQELPKYLSIADYSIFYYDDSEMTSGGIILSLSYGVPVITRNIPASEIIDNGCGYVFNTDEELLMILNTFKKEEVHDTIHSVIGNTPEKVSSSIHEIYESFS